MNKNLILLFEGMNYEFLMDLIDDGCLPNFKRILMDGYIEPLACNPVPYEAAGITSAFSGMNIEEHGILSYWKTNNPEYLPELWNSDHVRNLMVWDREPLKKYRIHLINLFGTFPAYTVNGSMISYSMEKTLHYTYPYDLQKQLTRNNIFFVQDTALLYKPDMQADQFYDRAKRIEELRFHMCKELLKDDFDLMIMNHTLLDRVSHFYMGELRDDSKKVKDTVICQAYQRCDEYLGKLLEDVIAQNVNLLFFSEMGFGPLKKFVEINGYLKEKGILEFQTSQTNLVDFERSVAFETVQGSHGININRKGKYKSGLVAEDEFESVLSDTIDILGKMKNPDNDNPMFRNVCRKEEVFGTHPWLPDIILEPFDWEYLPYGDSYWANFVDRHCQTGWHRPDSLWGGAGPMISGHKRSGICEIRDIASTIYYLLGEEQPLALRGSSLFV